MTILNDKQILKLCQEQQLLDLYVDHSVKVKYKDLNHETRFNKEDEEKIISYGLSSYGYDLRLADEYKVFYQQVSADNTSEGVKNIKCPDYMIDPKKDMDFFETSGIDYCIIPPNSFALGRSVEYIKMPRNVTGLATNKSTYARCGLNTPSTVLEAGWEGHLTIEMFNSTPHPIKVYSNEGIIQVLFFQGEDCLTSYADRDGKYQGQKGVTGAKV